MIRRTPRLVATIQKLRRHREATTRAEVDEIRKSGLFDKDYYLSVYPNVVAANVEPLLHFIEHGALEGRQPHPLFDTEYYLEMHPEIRRANINPILHYLRVGAAEELNPSPLFDTGYYLDLNPEAFGSGITPLQHYLDTIPNGPKMAHPLFNPVFYLRQNRTVAEKRVDPLLHYLQQDVMEDHDPHPWFSTRFYLEQYPDVKATGINPLVHFIRWGAAQRRTPSPKFDPIFYLNKNPTVASLGMNPLIHFLRYGSKQGLAPYRTLPDFAEFPHEPRLSHDKSPECLVRADEHNSALSTSLTDQQTSAGQRGTTEETAVIDRARLQKKLYATIATLPHPTKDNSMNEKPRVILTARPGEINTMASFTLTLLQGLSERGCNVELLLTTNEIATDDLPDITYRYLDDVIPGTGRPISAERWSRIIRYFVNETPCIFVPGTDYFASAVSAALPDDVGILGILHGDNLQQYEHATRLGRYWNAIVAVSECCYNQTVAINPRFKPITHHIPYGVELLELMSQTTSEKISSQYSNAQMTDIYMDVIREIWCEITSGLYHRPPMPGTVSDLGPILPPPWHERDPATFA